VAKVPAFKSSDDWNTRWSETFAADERERQRLADRYKHLDPREEKRAPDLTNRSFYKRSYGR
jgi:hypothetical protein